MADKETKGIVINIEAQTGTVSRQINALRAEFKNFQKDINAFNKAFDLDGKPLVSYQTQLYALENAASESTKVVKTLAEAMKKMESSGLNTDNIHSYALLAQRLAESKQQAQEATIKLEELKAKISVASDYAKTFGTNFENATKQIEQINTAFKFDPTTVETASAKMSLLETSAKSAEDALDMLQQEMQLRLKNGAELTDPAITQLAESIALMKNNVELSKTAISEYKKELDDASSGFTAAKEMAQEFSNEFIKLENTVQNLDTALEIDPRNLELVSAKMDVLDNAVETSKVKVEELSEALQIRLAQGMSYADPEVAELAASLAKAKQELESANAAAITYSNSLTPLAKEMTETAEGSEYISTSFSTFETSLKDVSGDVTNVVNALKKLRQDGLNNAKKAAEDTEKAITNLAKAMVLDPTGFEETSTILQLLDKEANETLEYINLLNQEIEEDIDSDYEGTTNEVAELKKECAEAYEKLSQLNNVMQKLQGTSKDSKDALEELADGNTDLKDTTEDLGDSTETTVAKIDSMTVALGNLAAQAVRSAISGIKQLATNVLNTGLEFDEANNSLKAMYGSVSDSEFDALSTKFRELGVSSEKSATEISEAAQSLALAGYNIKQTSNAIQPIMQLSEATGESFETLSSIVVDGLAEFDMESDQATHFADVLAKAALSTNTDVTDLGEALKYAGSVAGSFGYSVEDVAQALGTMASQGVKGTQAGSSLRTMLTRIAADTSGANTTLKNLGVNFFDANGNANDLSDTLDKLREVMQGMSTEEQAQLAYTVMGTRGLTALTAIVNTSAEDWEDLGTKIKNASGTVEQVANTRMDNLYGDIKKLSNTVDELSYTLLDTLKPAARETAQALTSLLQSNEMKLFVKTTGKQLSNVFKDIAKAIKNLTPNLNTVISSVKGGFEILASFAIGSKVTKFASAISKTFSNIQSMISGLTSGTLSLTTALGGIGGIVSILITTFTALNAIGEVVEGNWKDQHQELLEVTNAYDDLKDSLDSTKESMAESAKETYESYSNSQSLINELDSLVDANGRVKDGQENRVNYILGELSDAYGVEYTLVDGVIQKYGELRDELQKTAQEQAAYNYTQSLNDQLTELYQSVSENKSLMHDAATVLADEVNKFFEGNGALTKGGSNYIKEFFENSKEELGISYSDFLTYTEEQQKTFVAEHGTLFGQLFGDKALTEAKQNLDGLTTTYSETVENIQAIQEAINLANNGNLDGAIQLMYDYENEVVNSTSTTAEQIQALWLEYDALMSAEHETTNSNTLRALDEQKQSVIDSITELQGYTADPSNRVYIQTDTEQTQSSFDLAKTMLQGDYMALYEDPALNQDATDAGTTAGTNLADGTTAGVQEGFEADDGAIATASAEAEETDNAVAEGMSYDKAYMHGKNFLLGLTAGLADKVAVASFQSTVNNLASYASQAFASINQEHSPSRLAMKLGAYWTEGLAIGLRSGISDVQTAATDVAKVVSAGMAIGANAINSSLGNNSSNYTVNQNLTFNGSYSKRDGLSVARDLDRLLGGVI